MTAVARVVLVHGAFNELWGPNELRARWLPALRDGLWHHGVDLEESDVAVCFYGDLFRRHPGTDADRQLEQSRAGIAEALNDLPGGEALASLGQAANEAAFDRMVDMVAVLLTESDLRDRIRERLESVVGDETRVLVAHSLGSVLCYTALSTHPAWSVHTFVTLGSPLGQPIAFDTLEPAPVDGQGLWPGAIERWVNVRALNDMAAAVPLVEKFGPRVEEFLIDNGHRAHAPEPYLNCIATGAAIAAALGAD